MEDDLQAGECSPLEPLTLPPGVTPEIAARLTTGILMRQAYCSTTPWTQWLLLASVRILHGHGTPTLDSVSLHLLQGSLDEKLSCGDLLVDVEDAIPHLSTEEIKENANNFEKRNMASPCTKDHTDGNVDLGNTLNEEPSPAMKNAAEEEGEKFSYLEKEKFADNTTIPFIGDCKGAHTGLESAVNNVDKSNLEPSRYSMQSIVTEDKNILEISFNPSKRSTPKTSLVPFPKNYLCENDNSFNVSHHSPKDSNISNIAHNQQRSSISLEGGNKISQEKHCPDKEPNSIVMSQDHHKMHGRPEGNMPTELSNICKQHNLISDIMSAESDNAPCNSASTLIKKSVSIQVNPRKLGILTTKWVQVKGPRLTEVGVQADLPTYETEQTKSFDAQLDISGCADTLPKVFADKEMQTVIQNKRDKSSQTGEVNLKIENQPSQPLWNIISLSDLPKRKKNRAFREKDQMKSVAGDDNEKNALDNGFESSNAEKSIARGKKLFHGRPMAKGKMTKPVEIPLDAVARMQDPRIQG
ncbi:uncharacterized protein LOC123508449 [Portunus trituberculatus]|uniref:uncharacterized protein LOC123508449 n=1 Tax=Portunus trituberculatus TaxID=210409 RepID=UPI001E1D1A4D|nr:uncharacterized protein LOC123508449 [Portunus trituberculatus]